MTSSFETFFGGRLFCINCSHRQDRWTHASAMFARLGITVMRFEGITGIMVDGRANGNAGCTASHRALLDLQIANQWPTMFVFEDDADVIYHDFHERWERFERELPTTWAMIYLGAGLAEPPIARVSKHVIRTGRLMTTSSYGITLDHARRVAPTLSGVGPIDSLIQGFHRDHETYLIDPVCFLQYPNHSDLQERAMDNSASMLTRDLSGMV